MVLIYILCLPARSKEVKHYGPKMLIYTSVAPDWATFPKGIPKYDTLPSSG